MRSLYRLPGASLLVGDNVQLLHSLAERGIRAHLIGGSPPYNVLDGAKSYHGYDDRRLYEQYIWDAYAFANAAHLAAADGGRLWLNVPLDTNIGGKQPLMFDWHSCIVNAGWTYQTTILWLEGNVSRRTAWGSWLSPSAPFVNTAAEAILVYYKGDWKRHDRPYERTIARDEFMDWTLGLWKFSGANPKRHGHPAPFPEELPRRVVSLYSFPGDLVLDPWNGSGSTTRVAQSLGRYAIGIDQSPLYTYRAARRHLGDSGWYTAELRSEQAPGDVQPCLRVA